MVILLFFFNRNFALLWWGQFISSIGDSIFDVTVVLWITTIIAQKYTWASLAVSGVFLSVALPSLFISPVAGILVDRWEKRRTMLTMDMIRTVLMTLLFIVRMRIWQTPLLWMIGSRQGTANGIPHTT